MYASIVSCISVFFSQTSILDSVECSEDVVFFSSYTIVSVENSVVQIITAGSDSCVTSFKHSSTCVAAFSTYGNSPKDHYSINIRHADTVWPDSPVQYYPHEICKQHRGL